MRARTALTITTLLVTSALFRGVPASAQDDTAPSVKAANSERSVLPAPARGTQLPRPDPAFEGTINEIYKDSKPSYPQPVKPPKGAPNVLLILLDDVGFGMCSTFGGPVPTPHMDKLAGYGLKYTRFHTTALCSPTRAALLTGRNHHSVGTGVIIECGTGYPGYTGIIPRNCALVSETLRDNGYATAMFGKAHNTPELLCGAAVYVAPSRSIPGI
jgi:hypothetical protein